MNELLTVALPRQTWENRLIAVGTQRFFELGALDVELLLGLGIKVDRLGPRLVVCMWDEASDVEIGGYLVVDNLAMGSPSLGGIRMLGDITPATVHNLARGMTLKNAAAGLPFGGGKSGICAQGDRLSTEERDAVIRGFGRLIYRYRDLYNPGPDVGTSDADMKTIAIENGLDFVVSKPVEMGGNRIDQLGGAAWGVVLAIKAVLDRIEKLRKLPQFRDLVTPRGKDLTVLIQGFGAVGAHTARILDDVFASDPPCLVGVSDASGYLYCEGGLPAGELFRMWEQRFDRDRLVTRPFIRQWVEKGDWDRKLTFSLDPDALLRENAFCLVPAAPIAHYLGVEDDMTASINIERIGRWRMIVEGANTYSPDPERKARRHRMECAVYRERGVLVVTDYLVNSGGVILAAHERLIPTPPGLRLPQGSLGNREAVDEWLDHHAEQFAVLAEKRREAAMSRLASAIEHNMTEFIDRLAADPHRLPWEAAEQISISRISSQEKFRTAEDVMEPIATISPKATVPEAAKLLLHAHSNIIAVVDEGERLVGVITDRDITRSVAAGDCEVHTVESIMTSQVITVTPSSSIIECVRKLESFMISATPVLDGDRVVGMVSGDVLATRTLFRLLQTGP
jgi:glutamate dehydrogenase (NAD(P)+)